MVFARAASRHQISRGGSRCRAENGLALSSIWIGRCELGFERTKSYFPLRTSGLATKGRVPWSEF